VRIKVYSELFCRFSSGRKIHGPADVLRHPFVAVDLQSVGFLNISNRFWLPRKRNREYAIRRPSCFLRIRLSVAPGKILLHH
jgi:hypothetical protein